MFERLFEFLAQFGGHLRFWVVIDVYENGGVFRFGKYNRTLEPGIHWKLPFAEKVIEVNVCMTTMRLPPQTLTTKDGTSVVAASIVRYLIKDIQPYLCLVWDQNDVLADITMGAVRNATANCTLAELLESPPENKVLEEVRKGVNKYGFKVEAVTFTDLAQVMSLRLIQAHSKDLAN